MYKTIKDFKKLQFPLYTIPNDNWDINDGVVFVNNRVVDDLNWPGKSIGVRRLQAKWPDMWKLKKPLFYINDVLKTKKKFFISSGGEPFTYNKTGFQKVKYHQVRKFELRDTYTSVYVHGISIPLNIPRPPADFRFVSWARVLYYNDFPWMVFDFAYSKKGDTRIKV